MARMIGVLGCLMLAAFPAVGGYPTYYGYSYAPIYSYPTYIYSYYPAAYHGNRYWPAGYYYQANGYWYRQGYNGPYYGEEYSKVPSYSDPNWKSEIIKAASQRDEGALYLQAVKALGIGPPIQQPPGAYGHGYAASSYAAPVVQGQTLYTYDTLKSSYGDLNLNVLYQQASRLAQNQQSISAQATTEFSGLVGQAGDSAARVAEVLARGAAASQALTAAKPQASVTEQSRTTVIGPQGGATQVLQSQASTTQVQQVSASFLESYGKPLCVECHGEKGFKGKFQISLWPSMSEEQKDSVRAWMLQTKPDSACTGNKTGVLTPAQLRAFLTN